MNDRPPPPPMSDAPHPMPGWISVAPIPEPEQKPDEPPHPLILMLGGGEQLRIVRAIVLEIGEHPEQHQIPFGQGDTVFFTSNRGSIINGALFMLAGNVMAWNSDG